VNNFYLIPFLAVLFVGCISPEREKEINDAYYDRLFGNDPTPLRKQYVADHPELDEDSKRRLLSGLVTISTFESDLRYKKQQEDQEIEHQKSLKKMESDWKEQRAAREKARLDYAARPDLPKKIADAVLAQQVVLGMTTEQVQFSWGEPRNRSQSVSAAGTFETWSYPNHDTTVSFVNGKVESWMTTR
jgi:hypothetical protein